MRLPAKLRPVGVGFLLFLMVAVDSVSQILSLVEDGFFALCIGGIYWITKSKGKE